MKWSGDPSAGLAAHRALVAKVGGFAQGFLRKADPASRSRS